MFTHGLLRKLLKGGSGTTVVTALTEGTDPGAMCCKPGAVGNPGPRGKPGGGKPGAKPKPGGKGCRWCDAGGWTSC